MLFRSENESSFRCSHFALSYRAPWEDDSDQTACKNQGGFDNRRVWWTCAEVDLKIRGPGEIYGALQSGALDLRIASLSDTTLISLAQKQVKDFLKRQIPLDNYPELKSSIQKYQQLTTLN